MRILIQNGETGLYLCKGKNWSRDPAQGLAFLNEVRAQDHCVYHRLAHASVVILPESERPQGAAGSPTEPFPATNQQIEIEHMKPKIAQSGKSAKTKTAAVGTQKAGPKPAQAPPAPARPAAKTTPIEAVKIAPAPVLKEAPAAKVRAQAVGCEEQVVTTIEARVDVGLGNNLFIRGEGNGLSWNKGEPLRCVGGSTWVWSTACSLDKVVFKLVLNDQIWSRGDNMTAPAGRKTEVTPLF